MIQNMTEDQITLHIIKYLKENKQKEFDAIIDELHPYDIAKIYEDLPEKHRTRLLLHLKINVIADLIQELNRDEQFDVLNRLKIDRKNKVLDEMDNDDLASLLDELSPAKTEALLAGMKKEESQIVQDIINYPPETAGRLMTNRFVWIRDYYTVRDAVDKLKSFAQFAETISYLYVVDQHRKLVGVVSYRTYYWLMLGSGP